MACAAAAAAAAAGAGADGGGGAAAAADGADDADAAAVAVSCSHPHAGSYPATKKVKKRHTKVKNLLHCMGLTKSHITVSTQITLKNINSMKNLLLSRWAFHQLQRTLKSIMNSGLFTDKSKSHWGL